jgi:hypothetical protein
MMWAQIAQSGRYTSNNKNPAQRRLGYRLIPSSNALPAIYVSRKFSNRVPSRLVTVT